MNGPRPKKVYLGSASFEFARPFLARVLACLRALERERERTRTKVDGCSSFCAAGLGREMMRWQNVCIWRIWRRNVLQFHFRRGWIKVGEGEFNRFFCSFASLLHW